MMATKVLTVFGATGQQGGALVDHILHNSPALRSQYKLRAVTRNATKAAALTLKQNGVEVVEADMNDPPSLRLAVKGSYAVFTVTNCTLGDSICCDRDRQGKAMADAAVAEGVELLIWSSLPRNGMPQFESKAYVEDHIRTLHIKSVFLMPGFYMQLFKGPPMAPPAGTDGTLLFAGTFQASSQMPLINIVDTGKFLEPALLSPEKYHGKQLIGVEAIYNPAQICKVWTDHTGGTVKHEEQPGAKVISYYGPTGADGLAWTLQQLNEKPQMWEDFVKAEGPWF